jgi:voltage-gated potassium channel
MPFKKKPETRQPAASQSPVSSGKENKAKNQSSAANHWLHWRKRLFQLLEKEKTNQTARLIRVSLMGLILINVVAVILESDPEIFGRYQHFFTTLEVFSLAVFTIEYLLRVWVAVESPDRRFRHPVKGRLRYMLTPMAVVDLLAVAPVWFGMLVYRDLMILRGFRLIRVFKLTRYSRSMDLMVSVLKQEKGTLASAFFILGILIIMAAAGIHLVEGRQQPEAFGTVARAIWWAAVTLTTVGYGDVVPITPAGKAFGTFIVLIGVAMAALPAAILASGFSYEINRRREIFRARVMAMMADGQLDRKERRKLRELAEELGIPPSDASLIIKEITHEVRVFVQTECPHCHFPLQIDNRTGHLKVVKGKH